MAFGGSIKLTGESEYRKALKDISSDMRLMSSEMKVLATSTDASGNASDADRAKKAALAKAIGEQRDKLEALNKALADSNAQNGEASASSKALQTQINNATANLNRMESQLSGTGKETAGLGKEMDNTGSKASIFGDVLKANLASEVIVAGVKKMADTIATVGKAVIGMVQDSIAAYADYEQLVGGVETLFKQSSGTVKQYADEAYKTAGLSANQYMETVTSFSASLLQGLGGDTEAAARIGNVAVTDMADNANKMGTSIDLIQNAYQGFAKDNYTMLDNLKLGYGGTASEMARLVNDSGVMGASFQATAENVKDIPFDKLVESIHKTQEAMGITGTTAKEASSTISGSLNSVKASWENVMVAMTGGSNEQLKEAIDGLIEGVGNFTENITTLLPGIVEGIGQLAEGLIAQLPAIITALVPPLLSAINGLIQTISSTLPQLIPVVVQLLMQLVNTLIQNLPMIITAGIQILVALVQGIAQALPQLIPAIVDAVILMVTTLIDNMPLLIDAGIQLLLGLTEGLIKALPRLIDALPTIIDKLINYFINNLPKIVEMGIKIIIALAGALIQALPQLVSKLPQIITSIVTGLAEGVGKMANVGLDLVKGIWNGISNATGWIMDKIKGFGASVMNGIKSFFGIKSPSRKMRDEVGAMLAEGVGVGFEDNMKSVTKDMQAALPDSFDTGVNLTTAASSSLRAAAGTASSFAAGFDIGTLAAALKEALGGMNVMLDDEKVGSFVTDTIERKVLGTV